MVYDLGSYIDRVEGFINNIRGIYGIPRGGVIPATMLAHRYNTPLIMDKDLVVKDSGILVVDDISDSGTTLSEYSSLGLKTACLHIRKGTKVEPDYFLRSSEEMWIAYPYEMEGDTTPQYMIPNSFSAGYPNPPESSASLMPGDIQVKYPDKF